MDRLPPGPGRWRPSGVPAASLTVPALIASRVLDAELGALLWITVEANVPLIVAAADEAAPARPMLDAFLDFLPPVVERIDLEGPRETFAWLGDAAALGWTGDDEHLPAAGDVGTGPQRRPGIALPPRRMAPPETTYLVAGDVASDLGAGMSGPPLRLLVRALQRGYGLGATMRADSLEQVLVRLGSPPASVSADELRRLGLVIVLTRRVASAGRGPGSTDAGVVDTDTRGPSAAAGLGNRSRRGPRAAGSESAGNPSDRSADGAAERSAPTVVGAGEGIDVGAWRVGACHYIRPLERDAAGHLQRRPPAVLATWDRERDVVEHFEWGVVAELAMRVGLGRDEFEREHLARTRILSTLAASGRTSPRALRALLDRRSRQGAGGEG
ncbi:MAG TPA: hypothetical protein VN800_04700 [Candidatus Acidoferrales bacterium]|nr:hypothetical protein [Candidatus Acidoferrales bacterium]